MDISHPKAHAGIARPSVLQAMPLPMTMNSLSRVEGGAKRLAEIAGILARYGLADWLSGVDAPWIHNRFRDETGGNLARYSSEERVRLALQEIGATGIKLGQILSTREDLVGTRLAAELAKLQEQTAADSFEQVRALVERELAEPLDKPFAFFKPESTASASIGQIHEATLQSGQAVVVKVLHAGIETIVHRDLDIMLFLADLMEKHAPWLRQYQPRSVARDFRRTLLRELDFAYEARHLQEFARNFNADPVVRFPLVHAGLSTRRVLTMERLDGIPLTNVDALRASGENLSEFAHRAATVYLKMIFQHGFYHADPHAGNLMLMPGNSVGILDCGMVGRIDESLRDEIEGMLLAAVAPDPAQLVEIVCRIGSVPPELDREDLRVELSGLIADFRGQPMNHFDLNGALTRSIELIRRFQIRLPHGFALLLKTLIMLEGTLRRAHPAFNLTELLAPHYRQALRHTLAPQRMLYELAKSYRDWRRLINALPRDLTDILSRIRNESLEVHLEHRRLEETVNHLVKGLLASALFIGSSMILSTRLPPAPGGVSVPGALGCLAATFLAAQLLHAIAKPK